MTWETKEQNTVQLRLQDRFVITYEQLDFFPEAAKEEINQINCITDSYSFASSLLEAIGDHLSRRNLQDIIDECQKRLEEW